MEAATYTSPTSGESAAKRRRVNGLQNDVLKKSERRFTQRLEGVEGLGV